MPAFVVGFELEGPSWRALVERGLIALGEFGAEEVSIRPLHPEVAWLKDLRGTFGQPYDEMDRKRLATTITDTVPGLPAIEAAVEALVLFAPGVPEALLQWRILTISSEEQREVGDWNFEEMSASNELEWTEERARELQALGARAGLGPPRTFLLWESSD
jgi:hypothetical protein